MKKIRNLSVILSLFCFTAVLDYGCSETPITQIVPYSGSWNFTFTNNHNIAFARAFITVQDTGNFCGKVTVIQSGEIFYLIGGITFEGVITGGFSSSCQGQITGSLNGTFNELMGAVYASGTFNDTTRNPGYKGTWQAKRN